MKERVFPSEAEVKVSKVASFKEQVSFVDGRFIPLSPIPLGRPLFLTVKHFTYPFTEFGEEAKRVKLTSDDSILLLSVHDKPDFLSDPFGFIDWEIRKDTAYVDEWHGSHNQIHEKTIKSIKENKPSNWDWISFLAFEVQPEEEGKGVGSLLIASSLTALQALSIEKFKTSYHSVTDEAEIVWKTFGLPEKVCKGKETMPVAEAVNHPKIDRAIRRFI